MTACTPSFERITQALLLRRGDGGNRWSIRRRDTCEDAAGRRRRSLLRAGDLPSCRRRALRRTSPDSLAGRLRLRRVWAGRTAWRGEPRILAARAPPYTRRHSDSTREARSGRRLRARPRAQLGYCRDRLARLRI